MPNHTTGPAAPTPEEACADAPEPHVETAAMLNLARAHHGTPQMHDREWVPRHAALLDRMLLPAGTPVGMAGRPNPAAVGVAVQLRQMDRHGGTGRGPPGPAAAAWDGEDCEDGPIGHLRQEYPARRSGQLPDVAAVGAAVRTMSEVAGGDVGSGRAAHRAEPRPHGELLDLTRRRLAAYVRAVDFGIDAVDDRRRAERELGEPAAAAGDARAQAPPADRPPRGVCRRRRPGRPVRHRGRGRCPPPSGDPCRGCGGAARRRGGGCGRSPARRPGCRPARPPFCCPVRVGLGLGGRAAWDMRGMTSSPAQRPQHRRPAPRTAAPATEPPAAEASGQPPAVVCCRTWNTERLLPGGAVVATTWHEPVCPAARTRP